MLDMAYVDADSQCFDEGYLINSSGVPDVTMQYAGLFESTAWYKWQEAVPLWENTAYDKGDLVYADGVIFKALIAGTSAGENIYEDSVVDWENILRPTWKKNTYYHAHSFVFNLLQNKVWSIAAGGTSSATATGPDTDTVDTDTVTWVEIIRWQTNKTYTDNSYVLWDDYQLYYAESGGTSNGSQPFDDKGVSWQRADYQSWRPGVVYHAGDIATFEGMIFKAKIPNIASGSDIYAADFSSNWARLDEGYFEVVDNEEAALSYCNGATGTKHKKSGHTCITINSGVAGSSPDQVTAFAATGNFLNWAMASKFDIQKKILTGGKYDDDNERLISEGRGCAGSRFIKQVTLDDNMVPHPFYTRCQCRRPG